MMMRVVTFEVYKYPRDCYRCNDTKNAARSSKLLAAFALPFEVAVLKSILARCTEQAL